MLVEYSSSEDDEVDDEHSPTSRKAEIYLGATKSSGSVSAKPAKRSKEQLQSPSSTPSTKRSKISSHAQSALPPPLPDAFLNLYTTNPKLSQDSPLHEGRTRVVPHLEGAWPSHVYIEWTPSNQERNILTDLENEVKQNMPLVCRENSSSNGPSAADLKSLVTSDLGVNLSLHISLSPTLMIPTQHKEAFDRSIARAIGGSLFESCCLKVDPTHVYITANEIKTRAFVVLCLDAASCQLMRKLVHIVNKATQELELGLPVFEDEYTPHLSVAWYSITPKTAFLDVEEEESAGKGLGSGIGVGMRKIEIKDKGITQRLTDLEVHCKGVKMRMGKTTRMIEFSGEE